MISTWYLVFSTKYLPLFLSLFLFLCLFFVSVSVHVSFFAFPTQTDRQIEQVDKKQWEGHTYHYHKCMFEFNTFWLSWLHVAMRCSLISSAAHTTCNGWRCDIAIATCGASFHELRLHDRSLFFSAVRLIGKFAIYLYSWDYEDDHLHLRFYALTVFLDLSSEKRFMYLVFSTS